MTPIANMVQRMIAAGAAAEMIVLAVETAEIAAGVSTGLPPDIPVDAAAEKRRAYDRERKRLERLSTGHSTGLPPDIPPDRENASSLASVSKDSEKLKERKKERRGQKLPPDWKPSDRHFAEAEKLHLPRDAISAMAEDLRLWATANEHRAVGRKANWDAAFSTWMRRNQHTGATNGQRPHNGARQSAGADFFAGIAEVARDIDRDNPVAREPDDAIPLGRFNIDG